MTITILESCVVVFSIDQVLILQTQTIKGKNTRNVDIPRKIGFPKASAIKKNRPGEIIRKMKHESLSIDLLYNPTKYH